MTTPSDAESNDGTNVGAVAQIIEAANAKRLAQSRPSIQGLSIAHDDLSDAVLAARDLGVSWQTIGEALGIRRGAAYQRYRRRPGKPEPSQ